MRVQIAFASLLAPIVVAQSQSEWSVVAKPLLDVSGVAADGSIVFQNPGGATRLSNGNLLVADRGSTSIRLIDAKGKLVKSVGREGKGPGEYTLIISGNRCGADSMLVWARETAVMIGPSGEVARSFSIPSDTTRARPLMSLSCSTNGSIAYLSQPSSRVAAPTPNMMLMLASVVTVDGVGKVRSRLDSIPAGEWMPVPRGAFPRPMGPSTTVVIVGDRTIIGVSDSSRVWIVQPNGTRTSMRIPSTPRAPTAEEFADAVSAIADMAPVPVRPTVQPELAKAPVPARMPPYSGLFADSEGLLWVQTSPVGAKRTDLLAMSLDGRVVARTTIPAALSIYEIGRDYILGTTSDANDETHIVVMRLTRK